MYCGWSLWSRVVLCDAVYCSMLLSVSTLYRRLMCVCVCVRRFEELRSHIKVIKNSTKIRDVSRVSEGVCSVAVCVLSGV